MRHGSIAVGGPRRLGPVADQGSPSATNFMASIVAYRSLDAEDLGSFAFAMAAYGIALSVERGLVTQPLASIFSCRLMRIESRGRLPSGPAFLWVLLGC